MGIGIRIGIRIWWCARGTHTQTQTRARTGRRDGQMDGCHAEPLSLDTAVEGVGGARSRQRSRSTLRLTKEGPLKGKDIYLRSSMYSIIGSEV
jgi:hypothetical protein